MSMMRIAGAVVSIWLCVLALGCKDKASEEGAPDPAAVKAQQELLAKRDALLKARSQLQSDRDKLDIEIKEIEATGGDPSELVARRAELDTQIEKSTDDLLNSKLDALVVSGDRAARMASREAEMAAREKAIAEREARLAERERALVQRDHESAQRWKDSCGGGGAPVIIQAPATKDGNYTRKDVTAMIQKAKKAMAKKGLITSDLPGPAQSLESDATDAINAGDMSRAYIAAAQLSGHVDAITVNRQFIQAKTARLSAQVKSTKVDEATNKQLDEIIRDVSQKYNDGNFNAANQRLNQLAVMLAKKQ
jgi:hypothetical protein